MQHPNLFLCPIERLKPYKNNARTHSKDQIRQIVRSIERFGFTNPILLADDDTILAGHGRVEAAKLLGMGEVPAICLSHLSEAEKQAYILADNKLAENAGWDRDILAIELQALVDIEFDVDLTGFETAEIDLLFEEINPAFLEGGKDTSADVVPEVDAGPATCKQGDVWLLGSHRLMCGDARSKSDLQVLVGDEPIDMLFTDPPYNVPIQGHVSGLGSVQHREFAFASGEMSQSEFTSFLTETLGGAASVLRDGAIAFVCMDWRHMQEVLTAGHASFTELKNLCIWNKTNAGMGSFYRSKHELIFVFKNGDAPHTNTFGLGENGRYRTNVWDYAGATSFGASRDEDLSMHPTVKPVAMVADAIKDCTKQDETVLDIFAGSGSTLIAAETCHRRARVLEFDPHYCDTVIKRFEAFSGKQAVLRSTGQSFTDTKNEIMRGAA